MKKILVLDDVRENLIAIQDTLEDLIPDCLVLTAQSGKEGLKIARAEQPDTILTDVKMPGMDGFEVCKKLNEDEATKHIPVMIFTGSMTDSEARIKCLEAGAEVFLSKPIDAAELTAQINVLLRIKEAEDKLRAEKEQLDEKVKERTKELRDSEKKYRDLFEKSDDANLIIHNGKFVDCNQSTINMLRYNNKDEFLNSHPSELSPEKQPDGKMSFTKANEMMEIALKNGSHRFEWDHKRADGEVFPVEVLLTAISSDEKNQILHTVWRDITERKQAEEELKINRERLKTANSILCHDITNDIVVIKSALDIYRDEQDEDMLDEIEKRIEKSLNTIQKQRDQELFIDAHSDLDEYQIDNVAHDVIKNYPGIKVNITGTGTAYADNAIYSVFENIISNAIKHGKSTKLDIDIRSDEDHCEIRLSDYGIGIPDEYKHKIFDEGFQYGETGHTGIGLYIVQKTIDDYGGIVFVEDNKPNGAVIVIHLRKIIER